jgi:type VI secretion system protein ImpA
MTLDWITTPVSDAAPAGPDLWEADDPAYADYYFNALDRIDITYFKPGSILGDSQQPDEAFDPDSVSFKAEAARIDDLLKRTRDLRLLSLRARWAILAGKLGACVASVKAMADLLEAMPQAAHPALEGGPADRLEALNDLSHQETMLQPLRYLRLGGTSATFRLVMAARGTVTPRAGEDDVDLGEILGELRYAHAETEADRQQFQTLRNSLIRISDTAAGGVKPHFDQLFAVIDDILKLLNDAIPQEATVHEEVPDAPIRDTAEPVEAAQSARVPSSPAHAEIRSRDEAGARLRAVELYFGANEPSSAALLLVTQSRMLLGKSLIEAFEALMPDTAARASIRFSEETGFLLRHATLRALAQQASAPVQTLAQSSRSPNASLAVSEAKTAPHSEGQSAEDPPAPPKRSIDEILAQFETDSPWTAATSVSPRPSPAATMPPQPEVAPPQPNNFSEAGIDPELDAKAALYPVNSAQDASSQLQSIITYFNAMERSSPIPMLLTRARGYIGKDFETLLREFIPKQG